ncbi:MAG: 3-hydroxyacyl-CoA dehydrogenase family protein [Candidatus Heimdallarchaeota archaeon]|nr:3-hydroxyacyl-CoA dehydrogenase family protein [Candidatus Heimdallarchaeota archaeon]MCK4254744.1 3-hydroxyacyl-CoA dehydrogenase family protein [Candidatus Heimdallarchaeota archaeon]
MNRIAVIGSGTMGSGIALVFAQAKINVVLVDVEQKYLDNGLERIKKFLNKSIEKEKITQQESDEILKCVMLSTNVEEATKDVQLVIEAIIENEEAKKDLFKELDSVCSNEVIFASNTSALSISSLADATNRPSKFLGMHFFNPPQLMKLVEIIKGEKTSELVIDNIVALCARLGKTAVPSNEAPGFIVNRLLWSFLNEAYKLFENGVSDKKFIDTAIKLGLNHPMGPFELSDYIGLDVMLEIGKYLEEQLGASYKPAKILSKLVDEGKLGKKTKEGFYIYGE